MAFCDECGQRIIDDACGCDEPQASTEPEEFEVCPNCRGRGSMVHRGVSVWTAEDRDEDPEGFEDMMNGVYDVPCDECDGLRVVTRSSQRAKAEEREEYYLRLRESGIYPGSPDYY